AAAALATTGAAGPARARARLALARARMRAPEPAPARARLTMLEARRGRAMRVFLEGLRRRLAGADLALAHLDPMRVLARGYAVVRDAAGRPVRDASALAAGDPLEITFASGGARARVEKPY
ncbi:MAG: exodeoxyribonuclease VII large subunit, partial [Burkholderiales bacterium]|nr:exodeoxyribonuclease VII large subunit [Burkholderiales bacterium]